MDEADRRSVPDGVHADDPALLRTAYLPRQYAPGTRRDAGGKRGAAHCTAVRAGQLGESEHDERGTRHNHGGQLDAQCGKSRGKVTGGDSYEKAFGSPQPVPA